MSALPEPAAGPARLVGPGAPRPWYRRGPWTLLARDALLQSIIAACVLTTVLATFIVYPHHRYSVSLDGALYLVAVTIPALAMLTTARRSPEVRRAWLFMAAGVAANSVADVVYVTVDAHRHPLPNPGVSDIFYLLSYALLLVAVTLLARGSERVRTSLRLDGLIAALAVASLVAFIWYVPLMARGRGWAPAVVDLAYPVTDLVMLVFLATALAPTRYRPSWSSGSLLAGVACLLTGDVLHVSEIATNSVHGVSFSDMTFVVGTWLMGLAASLHDRRGASRRRRRDEVSLSVAAVPVVSGVIALGVIAARWIWPRPPEVGALALAASALVMARMWLALREERRLALTSSHDARTDALTGLANRRRLFELIEELHRVTDSRRVGVILIDLDGFKEVNDEIGHAAGDELLRIISQRFAHRLAERGTLARLGGDEFAVVRVAPQEDLVDLAHELLATTAEEFALQGHRVRLSASMGVALDAGNDPFELLRRADVAMYQAKRERVGVAVFVASDDTLKRVPRPYAGLASNSSERPATPS
ncbi:MAG: GGDEF domain-containing protein [Acidobacteriota bacterium]|nr:GGDEF domain-containing protein [Acidobacteriota bacterium]